MSPLPPPKPPAQPSPLFKVWAVLALAIAIAFCLHPNRTALFQKVLQRVKR